ncbi:MAG: alpha/beta fold hydrolase [Desulfobacterales bacterium]|nr:alpha/beta fold hydrolase [Desulfobacterales bacterium]
MNLNTTLIKRIVVILSIMISGVIVAGLTLYIQSYRSKQDLNLWHRTVLEKEFDASTPDTDLSAYFEREDRLFEELKERVVNKVSENSPDPINRFNRHSDVYPSSFTKNWNRSYFFEVENPKGAILLLHGLSDSPYSMHSIAEFFANQGYNALVLRLPGHGTTPGSLAESRWKDWSAAVRLAAVYAAEKAGKNGKFFLAGYSNGAALSIEYTLDSIEASELPCPDGLFLFSPAIGVTKLAFISKFQLLLSRLPGLEKLGWLDILPEYDPFKYNSFPTNAGYQIYRLTSSITSRISKFQNKDLMGNFPSVVTYVSAVDATVPIQAIINRLYDKLPENNSKLVMFDVNHTAEMEPFLKNLYDTQLNAFLERSNLKFELILITNKESAEIMIHHRLPGQSEWLKRPSDLSWPRGIYSLSHVAIPFSKNDPVYGAGSHELHTLGNLEARGERDVLRIPITLLMRLRYNPFFEYIEKDLEQSLKN